MKIFNNNQKNLKNFYHQTDKKLLKKIYPKQQWLKIHLLLYLLNYNKNMMNFKNGIPKFKNNKLNQTKKQ